MSDAIEGFCRFHGDSCDCSVDAISKSSAGLEGWANSERQEQQMNKIELHIDTDHLAAQKSLDLSLSQAMHLDSSHSDRGHRATTSVA